MKVRFVLIAVAIVRASGWVSAQESSEARPRGVGEAFSGLSRRLEADNWTPPYFRGHVLLLDPAEEERRLREMLAEPYQLVQAGRYEYRVSPRRVEEGKRLFFGFDFGSAGHWRSEQRYIFYAAGAGTSQELGARYGIQTDPNGQLIGIVGVPAPDGRIDYGWSCALCHAGVGPDGRPIPGAPNHRYDEASMRYHAMVEYADRPAYIGPGTLDRGIPVERLAQFGPGRHDGNGDRVVNPVKVPSLWGLTALRSGIFANGSIDNIWFALGGHNRGAPPASPFLEAIVAYVITLEPPPNPRPRGEAESRGEAIFGRAGCPACHSGASYTNGEVVPLATVGTDPERARAEFPKGYRVPTLRRLDLAGLFLHDGSIKSLPDLFSRSRLATVKGHEYGLDLSEQEKKDLVAFLLSI